MCHSHLYFCINVNLFAHIFVIFLFVLSLTDPQEKNTVALPEPIALIMTFVKTNLIYFAFVYFVSQ